MPILKVFELRTSSVTRNLDAVVADWTSILVVLLDFPTGNFETFPVVPIGYQLTVELG